MLKPLFLQLWRGATDLLPRQESSLLNESHIASTIDYLRRQPPFSIQTRSLRRMDSYVGQEGGDVRKSVSALSRDIVIMEMNSSQPEITFEAIWSHIRKGNAKWSGAVVIKEDQKICGYRTFDLNVNRSIAELEMNYVFVDPSYRGRGYRDLMDLHILGAVLHQGIPYQREVNLTFRRVQNPHNQQRYSQGGFEEIETQVECDPFPAEEDDESATNFSYFNPIASASFGVAWMTGMVPTSFRQTYTSYALASFLGSL